MKTLTTLGLLMMASLCLSAQKTDKDIPAWGKVEKADLEMKSCSFDPHAEAVVLFEVGEMASFNWSPLQLERRVRIKILNDKGLDKADVKIRFIGLRNEESIKNISAQTYNLDASGNIVTAKVDKKQIYTKKINKIYSEVAFSFPEVKAGSIIEYKYVHTNVGFLDWYFQWDIPVEYSQFTMDYPDAWEVMAVPYVSLPMEATRDSKGTRTIKKFVMHQIPALRDEPYISCEEDYLQKIETRLAAYTIDGVRTNRLYTWPRVVEVLMKDEDFGLQLGKNIPRTADLDAALASLKDPYARMVTIHNYVRKNMEWNGNSGIYAFDGVKSAWKEKKGSSGEINLILVNLLKDAGLDAFPVLVSSREHGRINTLNPDMNDFDKVIASVKIGDKAYYLDATDQYTPPNVIPPDVMFSEGLAIIKYDTYEWGWRTLWSDDQQYRTLTLMKLDIDEEGIMHGEMNQKAFEYARIERAPELKKGKEKFRDEYFVKANPGLEIDSFYMENESVDSLPLIQKLRFHQPLASSGEYKYFSVNQFTGFEKNPFVADSRFSDVFFGSNQTHDIVVTVTIPDDYQFEALPKSVRMIMPDTSISITRRIASNEHQLSVRINMNVNKPYFTTGEYPDFKEFYKKLFGLLSEQYVIRKKANP